MSDRTPIAFFIPCVPPTATAQGKGISARGGRVWTYQKPAQQEAEAFYRNVLRPYRPAVPLAGAVSLEVDVRWPFPKSHRNPRSQAWKTTKPDSTNWIKMIEDVMTDLGFWNDDAQVCQHIILRRWHDTPGIGITVESIE